MPCRAFTDNPMLLSWKPVGFVATCGGDRASYGLPVKSHFWTCQGCDLHESSPLVIALLPTPTAVLVGRSLSSSFPVSPDSCWVWFLFYVVLCFPVRCHTKAGGDCGGRYSLLPLDQVWEVHSCQSPFPWIIRCFYRECPSLISRRFHSLSGRSFSDPHSGNLVEWLEERPMKARIPA